MRFTPHFTKITSLIFISEQQIAQEQILELLPMVTEVNAISEELDKQRTFEVVLLSAAAQEGIYGSSKTAK